ncbi:protein DOWNSTREAM OF FLC-like [Triticum urartu]|uniref:Pollen-specific protein-like n=1 Tax=Triticum urartu TaxID=4572 RepID=A0A8R7UID3_TRIUA|nr:protein DOWNSTREAM OF FLC-like [Triticum urartu]
MARNCRAPAASSFMTLLLVAESLLGGGAEARKSGSNITVVGSVYCDACSNNTFSKHSFFLKGARVLIQCNFKVNSSAAPEEISLEAERTTDQHGVYKLDVPPVDGFECREGHELRSACRATLVRSSSAACNVPGLRGSTQHIALRGSRGAAACFLNLNALNFRPAKRDRKLCHDHGDGNGQDNGGSAFGSSLFFWPFLPLFWPPPLGLPSPAAPGAAGGTVSFPWPFHVPEWLVPFLRPPFLPFPLYQPAPGSSSSSAPPRFERFPPPQRTAARP